MPHGIKKRPQFCDLPPGVYKRLSKAALADIAWNLAAQLAESADDHVEVAALVLKEAMTTCRARGDAEPLPGLQTFIDSGLDTILGVRRSRS